MLWVWIKIAALVALLLWCFNLVACVHQPTQQSSTPPPFCASKLGQFAVHASNSPRFGTPLVSGPEGALYVCYVTPALATVVRRWEPTTQQWSAETVLDPQTHPDGYHTQCSLGMDREGHVHAAYNMHNTPWQYSVSANPHSVAPMVFRGQQAGTPPSTGTPKGNCTGQCAEDFMRNEPGIAAIPGNQVTYPHFGNTADGSLYVVYRECLLCDKSFHDRQFSMGMARYHLPQGSWVRVAGIRPFATAPGKLPMAGSLYGDSRNRLHLGFLWCNQYTSADGSAACFAQPNFISYARSDDAGTTWRTSAGTPLALPLVPDKSEVVSGPEWFDQANATGYYAGITLVTADSKQTPLVVVHPNTSNSDKKMNRGYVTRDGDHWTQPPTILGYSPTITYTDRQGRRIAVSSGMRVQVGETLWPLALEEGAYSLALDRSWLQRTGQLRLYANNQGTGQLHLWSLFWPESGTCQ